MSVNIYDSQADKLKLISGRAADAYSKAEIDAKITDIDNDIGEINEELSMSTKDYSTAYFSTFKITKYGKIKMLTLVSDGNSSPILPMGDYVDILTIDEEYRPTSVITQFLTSYTSSPQTSLVSILTSGQVRMVNYTASNGKLGINSTILYI